MKLYQLIAVMILVSIVVAGCAPKGGEAQTKDAALEKCRALVATEEDTESEEQERCERLLDEETSEGSPSTHADADDVLAGTVSEYRIFEKADYEKALAENKIVVLYFYANWCAACRAEQPEISAAFSELNDSNVIGFRVNFKDSDTDEDEEAMARQFGIAYQHTKVILKDGKQVLKAPDSWDKQRYLDEIRKVA